MGTSVNQASPRTLNWLAVQAGYRDSSVPAHRIATEVWRAATNQAAGDLAALLADPVVARVGQIALKARSPVELSRRTAIELVRNKEASLAADIARRAAAQCIRSKNRVGTYNERLFAEATAYLVSRDFPGFVGTGRAKTVANSLEFKAAVMKYVAGVARQIGTPSSLSSRKWAAHVRNVIAELRSGRR